MIPDIRGLPFKDKVKIANEMITLFDKGGEVAATLGKATWARYIIPIVLKSIERESEKLLGQMSEEETEEASAYIASIREMSVRFQEVSKTFQMFEEVVDKSLGLQRSWMGAVKGGKPPAQRGVAQTQVYQETMSARELQMREQDDEQKAMESLANSHY